MNKESTYQWNILYDLEHLLFAIFDRNMIIKRWFSNDVDCVQPSVFLSTCHFAKINWFFCVAEDIQGHNFVCMPQKCNFLVVKMKMKSNCI